MFFLVLFFRRGSGTEYDERVSKPVTGSRLASGEQRRAATIAVQTRQLAIKKAREERYAL
jgi:hypothetical protein